MEYEIVRYRPELKEGVLKLVEELWSVNPQVNAACFAWKYERNPYQTEPLLYLALYRNRVVGMRGACGARWEAGGAQEEFHVPCACDLVVAPDHRNRGVVSQIMRFAFDDLRKRGTEYIFNLSASQITFMNSLAMGWRSAGPWQITRRASLSETPPREGLKEFLAHWPPILKLARSVKNQLVVQNHGRATTRRLWANRDGAFSCLDRNFQLHKAWADRRVSMEKSPRPEAMADLICRIGSEGRIRHVRDRRYFEWRFQYPLSLYRFLFYGRSRLEGYLVLEARAPSSVGYRTGIRVSDWEATSVGVFEQLMRSAIRYGEFADMVTWENALPRVTKAVLDRTGFRRPEGPNGKVLHRRAVLARATQAGKEPAEWRLGGVPLLETARWDARPIFTL